MENTSLKIALFGCYKLVVFLVVMLFASCAKQNIPIVKTQNFNADWKFKLFENETVNEDFLNEEFDDSEWETVQIPHTAKLEPLVIKEQQWQGICYYRKYFDLPEYAENKHIGIQFGAAMNNCEIFLNGKHIFTNIGGYLPFYIDLTGKLNDVNNCIVVKLKNEDNPQILPGKPIKFLDFNYYSGLYRNIKLVVKDKIHITQSSQVDIIAGGGIVVKTENVDCNQASLYIKVNALNQTNVKNSVRIRSKIYDPACELIVTEISDRIKIESYKTHDFEFRSKLEAPVLWSPEAPELYTVLVELIKGSEIIDSESVKFGLRSIKFDKNGFYLNGEKYWLRGTNRHQDYPYIGYALSDNAQYRDAWKIKQAGFNFVRLSHYPQATAFLNACDELGIMVMNAIPGWQFFGDAVFQENAYNDIRRTIRRDRNHPSIILWEASLNESGMTEEFMEKANQIVHDELPGDEVYSCGWLDAAYDVFIPARQHGKAPDYWKKYSEDKPLFIAEYGDWEYYAQNAGFNQTEFKDLKKEERSSRQLRGNGQVKLAQQALNYQESHNDNLYGPAAGDANWLMFDYNRGYAPDIESSGIMDIFRLPKFSYHFYRSQKEVSSKDTVLFIANYWDDPTYTNVKVYSNCEEVELWLDDDLIARKYPDTDKNSTNLAHPPFTFKNVAYQKGKLSAKGFLNGNLVAESIRVSPGNPEKIEVSVDLSNRPLEANCNDIVFVYAKITDSDGNYVSTAKNEVLFEVEGDAELIGDNPVVSEAGIASILLKAGKNKGELKITATSIDLEKAIFTVEVK